MNSTNNGSARDLISRNCLIALAALSVANVIAHLIALPSLPAQIPTHWGAGGEINGWGPSWTATALGALPLGMLVLFCVIPLIDPKGNGYARAGKFYQRFVVVFTLLMIAVSWLPELSIWGVIAAKGSTNVIVSVLIGALLVGIGNYMPRIGQNYTMGVKTPWALNDPENWRRTQRFGGKCFVLMGIAVAAFGFAGPYISDGVAAAAISVVCLGGCIAMYAYSYLLFIGKIR